jgi:anti-sigma regulatory factor (Ser/Thr protein kinase)
VETANIETNAVGAPIETAFRERLVLPPTPESIRTGRRFVGDVLTLRGMDGQRDTATLLASEVVANAVVHAGTPFTVGVSVDIDRRELLVAVTDLAALPVLNPVAALGLRSLLNDPDLEAESGRGLMIVARLADRWGVQPAPPGKTVWFAVSLGPGSHLVA